jgi:hypothetical protein
MNKKSVEEFRYLIGLNLSHIWRGYGSALFLEFGELRPTTKRDGSNGAPEGEMGLMIEWSWRIERQRSVFCGSFSDERKQKKAFPIIQNCSVTTLSFFGRLPEIDVGLSNGMHILSFMTAEGAPAWTLFDRRHEVTRWLHVHRGALRVQSQ